MTHLSLNGQIIRFQPTQFVRPVNDTPRARNRAANCDRGDDPTCLAPVASVARSFHDCEVTGA